MNNRNEIFKEETADTFIRLEDKRTRLKNQLTSEFENPETMKEISHVVESSVTQYADFDDYSKVTKKIINMVREMVEVVVGQVYCAVNILELTPKKHTVYSDCASLLDNEIVKSEESMEYFLSLYKLRNSIAHEGEKTEAEMLETYKGVLKGVSSKEDIEKSVQFIIEATEHIIN